jgi:hypothetical protein
MYNRIYLEDATYSDIYINDRFAILSGFETNFVLQHSIYSCTPIMPHILRVLIQQILTLN